jgi:hypothetical protein
MTKPVSTPLAQLAKAYTFEKLRLDPRAGIAIGDEVWINLAGQLIRRGRMRQSRKIQRLTTSIDWKSGRSLMSSKGKNAWPGLMTGRMKDKE